MSFDPIEAAKLGTAVDVRRGPGRPPKPRLEVAPALEVVAPPPEDLPPLQKRYRVKESRQVSLNGSITVVSAGQIIDPNGYDEAHVKKLLIQGVQLEEID
jgi:hypothetical protein